jgi:type IV pilus assembly protein PilY1
MKKLEASTHIIFFALCVFVLGISTVQADDTDYFNESGGTNVPPNVLIIFDTSGSMAHYITTSTYDSTKSYAVTYPKTNLYYYDNGTWKEYHKWYTTTTYDRWGRPHTTTVDAGQATLSDLSTTTCSDLISTLQSQGTALNVHITEFTTSPYGFSCSATGTTSTQLCTGDYRNYLRDTTYYTQEAKVDVAKTAIKDLLSSIQNPDSLRFGLMIFNGNYSDGNSAQDRGGYVIAPLGSTYATIATAVDAIRCWYPGYGSSGTPYYTTPSGCRSGTSGGTPLAETLAEAGLYFSGGNSWANTSGMPGYPTTTNGLGVSGKYTSPIQWRCQKNYIIVITDGCPTVDDGSGNGDNIFTRSNYIDNKSIGHYYSTSPRDIDKDNEVNPWSATTPSIADGNIWMDDVAKFLFDVDLMNLTTNDNPSGASWNDTQNNSRFLKQNINTYAIGFGDESNMDFLDHVTNSSHGNGAAYLASEGVALRVALHGIVGDILKINSNYVAPVVPVSKLNRVYAGNSLYISLFRPIDGPEWKGNLKKFGFSNTGQILDKASVVDTTNYVADFTADPLPSSCWADSTNDGLEVDMGGAGARLLHQTGRSFLTNAGTTNDLMNTANSFSIANSLITNTVLGLASTASSTERSDLINFIRAEDVYTPITGTSKRAWVMGDVLHSRPAVLRDGTNNLIFVGSNDGFLHCFVDSEGSTPDTLSDDTVSEQWCFVPWDLIAQLHEIRDSNKHNYFVDGSPVLYRSGLNQYLTFGLRRGGSNYYTLKVGGFNYNATTNKYTYQTGTYANPSLAWEIDSATDTFRGESWCQPRLCNLKNGGSSVKAIVLAGGYDTNQDLSTPAATDTYGAAIYAVNASDGTLLSSLLKFTSSNLSSMTHSIVDLIVYDGNGDTYDDTIYAGDMGGQVFALKADKDTGVWSGRKLFQAGNGTTSTAQMKFFYAPDIATKGYKYTSGTTSMYSVYDHVYIGTGDREHPNTTTTVDRFYGIKNKNNTTVITESDTNFIDVTYYPYVSPHAVNDLKSNACDGWLIRMGYELGAQVRPGEKVVSSPSVFEGVVYFTTFTPTPAAVGDQCASGDAGQGYLYAVNYLTGEAVFDWYAGNNTILNGKAVAVYDERDRHLSLGAGIPPEPKVIVTSTGPILMVGPKTITLPNLKKIHEYFWIQD